MEVRVGGVEELGGVVVMEGLVEVSNRLLGRIVILKVQDLLPYLLP